MTFSKAVETEIASHFGEAIEALISEAELDKKAKALSAALGAASVLVRKDNDAKNWIIRCRRKEAGQSHSVVLPFKPAPQTAAKNAAPEKPQPEKSAAKAAR